MKTDPYNLKPEDKEAYINALVDKMQIDNGGGDKEYQKLLAEKMWDLRVAWYADK